MDHLGEASIWYSSYGHLISEKGKDSITDWSRLRSLETGLGLQDHLGEIAVWAVWALVSREREGFKNRLI
jgi:hypothetical protein